MAKYNPTKQTKPAIVHKKTFKPVASPEKQTNKKKNYVCHIPSPKPLHQPFIQFNSRSCVKIEYYFTGQFNFRSHVIMQGRHKLIKD